MQGVVEADANDLGGLGRHETRQRSARERLARLATPSPGSPVEQVPDGAALLGHVAAGTFANVDEAAAVVRTMPEVTEPGPHATQTYDALYDVYRSSYDATREGMHRLSSLAGS